jgi:transposase
MPANRGNNVSLMLAIKNSGIICYKMIDGSLNGNFFKEFIENDLRNHFFNNPSDLLVMDNCSFHYRSDVISLLGEKGILFHFLPPYTPQLNPIEEYFSHLKFNYSSGVRPKTSIQLKEKVIKLLQEESISFEGWLNI